MRVGAGLWNLQQSAMVPRSSAATYRGFIDEARRLEALGYDSLWLSEHHFFYDGYCPAVLTAASAALSATTRLRVGTGMLLLPLQEGERVARAAAQLSAASGGRFDLGVGLGYRDVEFDGKGLAKKDRLARSRTSLAAIARVAEPAGVTVWNGSATPAGVARAGARGQGVVLSGGNPLSLVRELAAAHRAGWEEAGRPGAARPRVSALRNVWLTSDSAERDAVLEYQRASYVLYAGLGWSVKATGDTPEMDFRADVDAAVAAAVATTIVGDRHEVLDGLREVAEAGVDDVILRVMIEGAPTPAVFDMLGRFADEVMPELDGLEAA
ncbi:LLM class flavin-dependent oxidoreductase [Homoserinibacter sp. GY 40078]|uniref:LLM class flavin-dependent oxidoreductase n=1 Tax=Homoserinibacter sp. GY 40078 TaxID=2603275 RepID=UPI0011CAF7B4|nr:LLM class flavin-dependent oxidoreductase [Homoserinibacter sp. GY 40078]TXK16973.1 LLM class flavin-dependent oxidoreductase [Homoserinibacter sp. GY 40078]